MTVTPSFGPGLSVREFVDSLPDQELQRFLDARAVQMLNAVFGGRISGSDLRKVILNTVDFDVLLREKEGRNHILRLIPEQKRAELADRLGSTDVASGTSDWSESEVRRLREFFGLVEERILPPAIPPTISIAPEYGLFDHQRHAVRKLAPLLNQDDRRAILHFPTGVGKTRTAMHVVAESLRVHEPSVVVWLASGRELLEQAVEAFEQAWTHLGTRPIEIGAMWGDRTPDLERFSDGFLAVGLAKGWSTISNIDPDWALRLSGRTRLVVFDEAHQSIARTYRRITEDVTMDFRCSLLGLTATPGRTWADIDKDGVLADFYGRSKVMLEVPGENPIEYLIDNGYLARPRFRTLLSKPGLEITENERTAIARALEIPREIVNTLSTSEQYISAVLAAIDDLLKADHRRVLVFAATVQHARMLSAILIARGVRSAVVTGETQLRQREHAIRTFKSTDETPIVLVNFGVLATGFDAPKASAVVIARPTQSLVLFSQMVGRAIRGPKAGGTESCEVVTVVDPSLPGFGDVAAAFLNWEDVWK